MKVDSNQPTVCFDFLSQKHKSPVMPGSSWNLSFPLSTGKVPEPIHQHSFDILKSNNSKTGLVIFSDNRYSLKRFCSSTKYHKKHSRIKNHIQYQILGCQEKPLSSHARTLEWRSFFNLKIRAYGLSSLNFFNSFLVVIALSSPVKNIFCCIRFCSSKIFSTPSSRGKQLLAAR